MVDRRKIRQKHSQTAQEWFRELQRNQQRSGFDFYDRERVADMDIETVPKEFVAATLQAAQRLRANDDPTRAESVSAPAVLLRREGEDPDLGVRQLGRAATSIFGGNLVAVDTRYASSSYELTGRVIGKLEEYRSRFGFGLVLEVPEPVEEVGERADLIYQVMDKFEVPSLRVILDLPSAASLPAVEPSSPAELESLQLHLNSIPQESSDPRRGFAPSLPDTWWEG